MTVVFTFLFMLLIVAAMAVGVMMGRKPIAGSCGGIRALGLGGRCEVCGGDPQACEGADGGRERDTARAASLGSDATTSGGRRDVRSL